MNHALDKFCPGRVAGSVHGRADAQVVEGTVDADGLAQLYAAKAMNLVRRTPVPRCDERRTGRVRSGMLRYRVDAWPIGLVLGATVLGLLPFVRPLDPWQLGLLWVSIVYLRTFCAFIQHNHAHLPTFNAKLANRLYDVILAQNTGYPTALWELHHNLGHHRNLLVPEKDVASLLLSGSRLPMSRWMYALRGSLTIHRDSVRLGLVERVRGNRRLLTKLMIETAAQTAILVLLFARSPWLAMAFFVVPNAFTSWLIWWESYPHHLNMPTTSIYDSSMTVDDRAYNFMTFNIGHHTAHHQKPTLHWSLLPAHTARIRHLIHEKCLKTRYATFASRLSFQASAVGGGSAKQASVPDS
jgi:beta-carotene hydroxylase